MTLKNLIDRIAKYGISRKLINWSSAGADIFAINSQSIREYPILFTSPTGSHRVEENTTTYSITLYYIDRLLRDSSNDIDIFSSAVEQLKAIVIGIAQIDGVVGVSDSYNVLNFTETERLSDSCAGAYCTIEVTVLNDFICVDE